MQSLFPMADFLHRAKKPCQPAFLTKFLLRRSNCFLLDVIQILLIIMAMQPQGKLVLIRDGVPVEEFALPDGVVTLGRAEINDVVLNHHTVSRAHAKLERSDAGWTIIDLGSANGTRVNGVPVQKKTISSGDALSLGDSALRFESAEIRQEPAVTQIASLKDLEQTLAEETLVSTLKNTRDPRLVIHKPGKTAEVPLVEEVVTLGRDPDSRIFLDDPEASRHHARIEHRGHSLLYRDLDSRNGTWLGSERVHEHVFKDGDALRIGHLRLIFKAGFAPEELTVVDPPMLGKKSERRPVVIVPGIMGSELWAGGKCIWPNLKHIFTHPESLSLPDEEQFEVRGMVNEVIVVPNLIKLARYGRLGNYLEEELGYERGKNLLEFGYDWRQDNRESARKLAATIESWQKRCKEAARPIIIIAHSMGSLVSRYYVERLGGKEKVERIIFLGAPHYGAPKMIATLLKGPKLLPFGLLGEKLRQMGVTLPSMYQLLPNYFCAADQKGQRINVLVDESWLAEAQRPHLRNARAFRQELGPHSSIPSISVFGYGLKTITNIAVQTNARGQWQKVDFSLEASGDGTVPETSAVLEGSEIHPVCQYHGSLYTDNDVMMRLKLELTRGLGVRPRS